MTDNGKLGTKRGAWAGWDICKFEIRDAGNDEIALRHPGTGRWLRMTAQGCVFSTGPKIPGSAFELHDAGDGPLSLTGAAPEWPSGRRISLRGASMSFHPGDRVEAKFQGGDQWYAGTISRVTEDACDVAYDDGDREENVSVALIRSRLVQAQQLARGTRVCVINDEQAVRAAFRAKDIWRLLMPDSWHASLGGEFIVERHDQNDSTLLLVKPGAYNEHQANDGQWWPYSVLCLDKPRRWLEVGGKRAFEIADIQKMERFAAEAKRRAEAEAAAEAKRRAGEAEARANEIAADEKRRTDAETELRAAAADEARARAAAKERRRAGRIDCESPRIDLSGNSELSSKIDALFKVRRSPALAEELNKIFENHDAIPKYCA